MPGPCRTLSPRFPAIRINAGDASAVAEAARAHRCDLVMNAVDPQFVMPIFTGALEAGTHYVDMAMSLSKPHPTRPHELPGTKLGDEQFALAGEWESRGRLALVGMGMDPGLSDVFAAHAAKHLLDEVHEVHVRDGGDLAIPGYAFAPVFSIWTTIEECLNPPIVWDEGAWRTTVPFSGAEAFPFPEGIGPMDCVNVEHEEVLLVPRSIPAGRVTFKYALGTDFIDKLRTIHALGMDRTDRVRVKGVEVAPRDVLAAITPTRSRSATRWLVGRLWAPGASAPGTAHRARSSATSSRTRRRPGAATASRSSAGRRASTRFSPWSCSAPAPGPVPACSARRPSTPTPTSR